MNKRGLIGSIILLIIGVAVVVYLVILTTGGLSIKTDKVNVDIAYNEQGNDEIETIEVSAGSQQPVADEEPVEESEIEGDLIVPVTANETNASLNYTNVSQ